MEKIHTVFCVSIFMLKNLLLKKYLRMTSKNYEYSKVFGFGRTNTQHKIDILNYVVYNKDG